MSEALQIERPKAEVKLGIFDGDIHPTLRQTSDLYPFLEKRWVRHIEEYGFNYRGHPFDSTAPLYPRSQPALARRDAWPPEGGPPGSSLSFMRSQHLDPNNIDIGVMQVFSPTVSAEPNHEFCAALCTAVNDWQAAVWADPEPRLRGAVVVPQEDAAASVAEIERLAGDRRFLQVGMAPRCIEPIGKPRFWPIYAAAEAAGLPIGLHVSGFGGHATSAAGWMSYYAEDHPASIQTLQAVMTSLIAEGVCERFPKLRFIFIEGGWAWVPSLSRRLDKQWERFRTEVPHVKRPPSEYVREQFYYTTQQIEEPEVQAHLRDIIDQIGWDRMLFSTDYPHWDFDDPQTTFKIPLSKAEREAIFRGNARALYRL